MGCGSSTQPADANPAASGSSELLDSTSELAFSAEEQVEMVIAFWERNGEGKVELTLEQKSSLVKAYSELQDVFKTHQTRVHGLFEKMAKLGDSAGDGEWKELEGAAAEANQEIDKARDGVNAVLAPSQKALALKAVHKVSARGWEDIGDLCRSMNVGSHLSMFYAVPSAFEPAVAGHVAAEGQHRYWMVKCLKKAGVSEETRGKILAHVKAYKQKARDLRAQIETSLQAVAEQPESGEGIDSLNAAVKASMDARVELLGVVYGEMSVPEKCRVAACTLASC